MHLKPRILVMAAVLLVGAPGFSQSSRSGAQPPVEVVLERVAAIHGAAGVFAVAGYRMGERALRELAADRRSFALDVTHRTPMQVQYSCVADGWQAATGVSAGKLNLHIVEVRPQETETVIRNGKTGQTLVFRLQKTFLEKYLDVPQNKQKEAGREVAMLPDAQIFTISTPASKKR